MSQLPLAFNGLTVGLDQLSGYNYVAGFPELIQALWRHNQDTQMGYSAIGTFIYPLPGKQRIYGPKGRSWKPGARLRAFRAGNTGDWRIVNLLSYDAVTGIAYIEVVGTSIFESAAMGGATAYFMMPYFTDMAQSTALGFAAGGTAASSVDDARVALQLPIHKKYAQFYTDFLEPVSFCRLSNATTDLGPATPVMPLSANLSEDFATHPGIFRLSTNAASVQQVSLGRPVIGTGWADMTGDDTYFETIVRLPTLSTGGLYKLEIGLIGTNAKISFSYIDTVNTARFQYIYGINASYTTVNSALPPLAGNWYKASISISGANVFMQIGGLNGTVNTTVAKATYQGLTPFNWMVPMVKITQNSAGAAVADVDYIYFRKHFPNGR